MPYIAMFTFKSLFAVVRLAVIFAYPLLMNEFASSSFDFLGWLLFVNNVTIHKKVIIEKSHHILKKVKKKSSKESSYS